MILNNYILSDKNREIEEMEDEFQLMYLASTIVDCAFNFFKIKRKISNVGKPPFSSKSNNICQHSVFVKKLKKKKSKVA